MAVHVIATSVTFAIAISLTLTYELDSVQRCASCALGVKQPISLRPGSRSAIRPWWNSARAWRHREFTHRGTEKI